MYFDKLQVGSKLAPRTPDTIGYGVIVKMGDEKYVVCTDFGNIITFGKEGLDEFYSNETFYHQTPYDDELIDCGAIDDLKERWLLQIDNLKNALEIYCK